MSDIKRDTIHGVKWNGINRFSNTIVSFLVGIVLARLLDPSDYGTVGMTAIFFAIAAIFIDGGFGTALIRKKSLTEDDCSTIFYFNITASIIAYFILFFSSPYIAAFLKVPVLKDVIRVSGLNMVIGSFGSIHFALLTKKVDFKTPAILSVGLNLLNAVISIYLAYNEYGVWALVFPGVMICFFKVILIWIISPWRPKWIFSMKSFKEMFSFSSNLVINSILDKFYNEGTQMVIGRYYTPQTLGYYSKGMNTAQLPSMSLYGIVGSVTFPILAKIQDDNDTLVHVYRKYIRILSMVIFFVMILLAALAKPYILFLYSEKWEPAIIFVQLFCFRYLLFHIHAINWNLLLVKGRSDIALKKEIINKTVKFTLLIVSIPFGVVAICLAQICGSIFDLFVNTYYAGKVCGMGLKTQASDFVPYLIFSVIACLPALLVSQLNINYIISICVGIIISSLIYWGGLWIKKDDSFLSLVELTPLKRFKKQ